MTSVPKLFCLQAEESMGRRSPILTEQRVGAIVLAGWIIGVLLLLSQCVS